MSENLKYLDHFYLNYHKISCFLPNIDYSKIETSQDKSDQLKFENLRYLKIETFQDKSDQLKSEIFKKNSEESIIFNLLFVKFKEIF